jgi:hypothetical protein
VSEALFPEMRRPLPSFKQWLEKEGVTGLSEDADALFALRQLAQKTLEQRTDDLALHERCFLRLWQGMLVAAVELSNIEFIKGVPHHVIIGMLPRVMAAASMYAVASACEMDSDWRAIGKILTEEFRAGVNASADQLTESYREERS